MKLDKALIEKIRSQLDSHLGVDLPPPKFKLISDPQKYFQVYTGEKRKFSIKEMLALDEEVSVYYNDDIDAVIFKKFRRNGLKTFKVLSTQSFDLAYILHEWIHSIQTKTGGYSKYDFFDEACDETVTYVLTADMPHLSDYQDWVCKLWNFIDVVETRPGKKYELIRNYNVAENKTELADSWLKAFIEKYPRIASTKKALIKILEADYTELDNYAYKILYKMDESMVTNYIYKLHDTAKESLYSIFR